MIINKKYLINELINTLNTFHNNFKFTMEKENNHKLLFLNIEIHKLPNGRLTYKTSHRRICIHRIGWRTHRHSMPIV